MAEYHLVQVFRVPAVPAVFDQCDRLMEALMDAEDDAVRDAAVSADAERGLAIVEVTTSAEDRIKAEIAGLDRIHEAMQQARIPINEMVERREMGELVAA